MEHGNVEKYHELIGHPVRVEFEKNAHKNKLEGNLYTVDPISGDVVVMLFNNNKPHQMKWIPHRSFTSISLVEEPSGSSVAFSVEVKEMMANLFHDDSTVDPEAVAERKKTLITWLRRNHVEVKENGPQLVIFGSAQVLPPYTEYQCFCDNAIVLRRVKAMLAKCPV